MVNTMKITKIDIRNFKSFEDISAELNDFNVIVGASASGKSNFIEAFRFLKDVVRILKKSSIIMEVIFLKISIWIAVIPHALK